ncbi:hypothetical protein BN946_scf184796.g15 [Trametes cinnabarina]|uniref:Integrase zinc-binding domain-containing protein n=1 Tax=Pycnoporus cinnabarinus TaxID=5643 RepID=A0A060SRD7_PYCCI|nr:hypothetical protein BN946_scf184796.g15 [Trametes cinnabarina]
MAESPAGSESPNDSGDDSQLTIRIPNPKVYMARQSQWKGRRGKPRDRPVAPYASKTASFLVNEHAADEDSPKNGTPAGPSSGPVYEGEMRTEPQIRQYVPPHPPPPGAIDEDAPMEQDADGSFQQSGPDGSFTWVTFLSIGMIVTTPHIDPWMHPSFVPLPEAILLGLRAVNAIEMPSRHAFDEALIKFLGTLSQELRDTATFPPDVYAQVARAVSDNHLSSLSPRLQTWTSCHHARSGSSKRHLILLPRDAFYNMNREDEEKLRLNYVMQADGEENSESAKKLAENGLSPAQSAAVFERVPVQNQIYDVLVYTHRNHGPSATMLFEARRIGVATITWPMVEMFIRLCPLCKLRSKGGPRPSGADEESASFRAGSAPVIKR